MTTFGKELRKLRIEQAVRLKDLAEAIEVTSAFLSAVETGKKTLPPAHLGKLVSFFGLKAKRASKLEALAAKSAKEVRINLARASNPSKDLAAAFARKFNSLDEETIANLRRVLEEADK